MNPLNAAARKNMGPSQDPTSAPDPVADDPRVTQPLREYLAAVEAGHKPNRQEFVARYPEIAGALAECLDGLDFIRTAAPQLHQAVEKPPTAIGGPSADIQPELPLGDYRIVREVGRGGMGVVYEAVQLSLGRRVALKVLPFAAALDGKQLQRFKNEAQAAAHLHHTNIVPVFGVGVERGVHCYAMQFIDGTTLAGLVQEQRQRHGLDGPDAQAAAGAAQASAGRPTWDQATGPFGQLPGQVRPAASTPRPGAVLSTEHSARDPGYFRTVAALGIQAAEALAEGPRFGRRARPEDARPAARGRAPRVAEVVGKSHGTPKARRGVIHGATEQNGAVFHGHLIPTGV